MFLQQLIKIPTNYIKTRLRDWIPLFFVYDHQGYISILPFVKKATIIVYFNQWRSFAHGREDLEESDCQKIKN